MYIHLLKQAFSYLTLLTGFVHQQFTLKVGISNSEGDGGLLLIYTLYRSQIPDATIDVEHIDIPALRKVICKQEILTGEQFEDVIFTDESRIEICRTSGKCFMQDGHAAPYQPKPKHPYAVLVWGGISMRGATDLLIFKGIMKGQFNRDVILKDCLKPFIQELYPDRHRLMQDNDPKHTAHATEEYMIDNDIK